MKKAKKARWLTKLRRMTPVESAAGKVTVWPIDRAHSDRLKADSLSGFQLTPRLFRACPANLSVRLSGFLSVRCPANRA